MVLGVLNQAFDVLVLRYGVQKRIYCNVSAGPPSRSARRGWGVQRPAAGQTHVGWNECQGCAVPVPPLRH